MRRAALVILLSLVPSIAAAQKASPTAPPPPPPPPSKTLERAIKLYDVEDFYSASIELKKVLDGETGDGPENVERARFFMGKTFFQIGFYVPSLVMLTQIIQAGGTYSTISFKWIAGLRAHLPDSHLAPALATLTDDHLDDPSLAQSREDLVAIQRAKIPVRHDLHLISRNALGCTHPDTAQMTALVEKLRSLDDDFELVHAVRMKFRENDALAQAIDLAMQKTPAVRDARRWVGELKDELELLMKSDKAWQTTMVAAELLQEITVQHSVAEAELGKHLRRLIDAMSTEVAGTARYNTSPELCTREATPTLAGTPSSATGPMVVQPKSHGCGCQTGDSRNGSAAGLLVVLVAVALRKRSRAASRTRSLPA